MIDVNRFSCTRLAMTATHEKWEIVDNESPDNKTHVSFEKGKGLANEAAYEALDRLLAYERQ